MRNVLICLCFIEDAVEKANGIELFGGDCATESALLYHADQHTGVLPKGSFVFDSSDPANGEQAYWGHCGLCIGDSRVIHARDTVRIDPYLDIPLLSPAPEWSQPRYVG